jgi:limonene-1,2-epoxide hydrolase
MSTIDANKRLVTDFFAAWGRSFDDMIESFRVALAPDCLIKMTRTPDMIGLQQLQPFMDTVRAAGVIETMDVEVLRMIATDDCVVCERIDTMHAPGGAVTARLPTFSLMDIRDGKITEWHDYFDSADMPTGSMDVVAVSTPS